MRPPLQQKLPLVENISFIAQTFRTPDFEVGWHQHIEYELILFTEGSGQSFIGNYVGEFETGDVYFLGSDLPHTFQKREPDLVTSAVVVQFRGDFWGNELLALPEGREIRHLLEISAQGLKMPAPVKLQLAPLIREMEKAIGFKRLLLLGECLDKMAGKTSYEPLSTQVIAYSDNRERENLDRVFEFTINNFREKIELAAVAKLVYMSEPAFCNFFKRCTKKTYIAFLNEVRVGYACNLLVDTKKTVLDICYKSGYNTMAHFHKQFLKLKKLTPLQYRKLFE